MQRDAIIKQIKDCIAEILIIDDEDLIELQSDLADDLGAESIDYVEIIHVLSRTFDIQMNREDAYPERGFLADKHFINEEHMITDEGFNALHEKWPHLKTQGLKTHKEFVQYVNSLALLVDFFEYQLRDK